MGKEVGCVPLAYKTISREKESILTYLRSHSLLGMR